MQISRIEGLLSEAPSLRFHGAGSPEGHANWAGCVKGVVQRLLDLDAIEPLTVVSVEARGGADLLIEEHTFAAPGRPAFRGTLLRPADGASCPAVLVCPGRNARLDAVTGLEPPDHPDRNVAQRLAESGFATLTLDYGLLGGLDPGLVGSRDETGLLAHALALVGRSPLALLVEDALRAMEWLRAQPWLEERRVALFGHSLGGHVALHAALASEEPVPVVLASCLGDYAGMFARRLNAGGAHALPGILRHADLPDLAAALAPAPLQVQHGLEDAVLPVEDARAALETVRASYAAAGAPDALDPALLPMGHGTDVERAAAFLRSAMSRPARRLAVPAAKIYFSGRARTEILDRIDDSLTTGALTLGPYGRRFEELAQTCTGSPTVAVSGGTSALEVALRVLGVAGRTVLVPANTFFATAGAALHAGARVRFVDTENEGLGMEPGRLVEALDEEPDVAAVVVVHIGGIISESVPEVAAECARRGIPLVEDGAHALGSSLHGVPAGAFGRMAAFSMYPTKIVTSGEGGFVVTPEEADLDAARCLRDQGKLSFTANVHGRLGSNWRMSEIHASIGIAHLERLPAFIEERERLARWYDRHLESLPGLRVLPIRPGLRTNYYKYIALLDEGIDREDLQARLRSRHRVSLSGPVYQIPCCAQPYFQGAHGPALFPNAYRFCERHICLPLFATMTTAQQEAVVEALASELPEAGLARGSSVSLHTYSGR